MHKKYLAALMTSVLFGVSAAHAAPVSQSLHIEASDFSLSFGSASPAPVSPLEIDFSVSFDNAANINATTAGLAVDFFNLGYAVQYAYNAVLDALVLASLPSPGGCTNPANSFCIFIDDISTATPNVFFAQQSTSSGGYWTANTISSAPQAAVPEPGALTLLALGLVGAGLFGRRKH